MGVTSLGSLRVYFIAPVFGSVQLRVSFAVVNGPPHNTRGFAFFVADACDITWLYPVHI